MEIEEGVLTNLCSWVSTISQTQLHKVKKILISVLLDSSSSPLNSTMVADIWCFLARPGTSHPSGAVRVVECRQDKKVLAECGHTGRGEGEGVGQHGHGGDAWGLGGDAGGLGG